MVFMEKCYRLYVQLVELASVLGVAAVAVLAIVQVIFRYVLSNSLSWTDETMRYTTIWVVCLIAGLAFARGQMLGFTMLAGALPAKLQEILQIVLNLFFVAFLAAIAVYGTRFALRTLDDEAVSIPVSMFWFHLAIPSACVIIALHALGAAVMAFNRLRSGDYVGETQE